MHICKYSPGNSVGKESSCNAGPIPPSISCLFQSVNSLHEVAKVLEIQL